MKQRFLIAAAALSLGFTALPAFAQSSGGDMAKPSGTMSKKEDCDQLQGTARTACLKGEITPSPRTPGRSEDAAAREGGRTPGRSEDSASRTGVPPGQIDKNLPAPAAGGAPKDSAPKN